MNYYERVSTQTNKTKNTDNNNKKQYVCSQYQVLLQIYLSKYI